MVFDYGEHDLNQPTPDDSQQSWPVRRDPFSSYRAGFEVRTYRLCQRVLMFHHFPRRARYCRTIWCAPPISLTATSRSPPIRAIRSFPFCFRSAQCGYKRQADGSYLKKSLPPLEFEYTQPMVSEAIHEADPESLKNLPYGLDNGPYQWVDLDGEGLSGVLTEQAEGWFYKRNLSPINEQMDGSGIAVQLGAIERVAETPSLAGGSSVSRPGRRWAARPGCVCRSDSGIFRAHPEESWGPFSAFTSLPVLNWNDPNLKFVDLDGRRPRRHFDQRRRSLLLVSLVGRRRFRQRRKAVHKALDEEEGPRLVFADGTQSIYLADFSGDGLTDLVRIRNGEVCYWPNLGYGRFGAKVTMDHAPCFDAARLIRSTPHPAGRHRRFRGHRYHLSERRRRRSVLQSVRQQLEPGAALTCFSRHRQSGLRASRRSARQRHRLPGVVLAATRRSAKTPLRYIDLMGGQKPHLLIKSVNNLGAETHVRYAPSTKFYLADKLAGRPWISKIPFPVHVVERVETYDRISRNRFVTRYAYHHGYFDGIEREFRGFGMVEQWDTEEFAALGQSQEFPAADNIDESSHVPPVLTKTWFHTGVYVGRDQVSNFFAGLVG